MADIINNHYPCPEVVVNPGREIGSTLGRGRLGFASGGCNCFCQERDTIPLPSLPAQQSVRSCHFSTRKMYPSEPCTPGDWGWGASPSGTKGFRSAGPCTDPGAVYLFHSVATSRSIISEEQAIKLFLSLCHHFPSHTHRMSTWPLTSNSGSRRDAQERAATAQSAWGVRTGPCRQTDRKIEGPGTP